MKIKLPEKDYYTLEDLLEDGGMKKPDLYHFTNEKKCLRLSYLKSKMWIDDDAYKCMKINEGQAQFIFDIQSKSHEGSYVSKFHSIEKIVELYKEDEEKDFILQPLQPLPDVFYIIPSRANDFTIKWQEGLEDMFLNFITVFQNFHGELFFIVENINYLKSKKEKYCLAGLEIENDEDVTPVLPVLMLEEKRRFESEEPIANLVTFNNKKSNISEKFYNYDCYDLEALTAAVNEFWNKKDLSEALIKRNKNQVVISWVKREYPKISESKAEYIAKLIRPDKAN